MTVLAVSSWASPRHVQTALRPTLACAEDRGPDCPGRCCGVRGEVAWIGASSSFVTVDFGALGLWLAVTGALILVGTSLALLGPTPHGGIATNSQDMLVSSGTRSLWDLTKSPGLHVTRSQALVAVGVGSVLILLGALFTVL